MNLARNRAAGGFCIAADRLKHHPDLAVTGVSSEALFRGEAKSFFVGSMAVGSTEIRSAPWKRFSLAIITQCPLSWAGGVGRGETFNANNSIAS